MPDPEPPRTVKDFLVEAKDVSELMVDLAYAAVFFGDEELAEEVEVLQERMAGYLREIREVSMVTGRTPGDAEAMGSVLHLAAAIDIVGGAASDIGRVVEARLGIPPALRPDLRHADEIVGRVRVRDDAPAVRRSLRELRLPSETGLWLLAIRRGTEWTFDPQAGTVVLGGDVLLFQGPEEGANLLRELAGAPLLPPPPEADEADEAEEQEIQPSRLSELDRAVDILVEMKNSAEVAVGLAYSSLLFNDRALASEVATLESRSDVLQDELESWVLRAAPEAGAVDDLRGLLRLAYASERIFDAARDMTWLVEQGEQLHPVIQAAISESEEVAAQTVVEPGSRVEGRSLKELQLETETGMFVLAVQRGRRWIYRPRPRFQLAAGDRVISIGPEDGIRELDQLCRAPSAALDRA